MILSSVDNSHGCQVCKGSHVAPVSANNPSLSLMCLSLEPEGQWPRTSSALTAARLELAFCPPPWEGTSLRPCPACARGFGLCAARMPGGLGAKGNCIVFPTHMLDSLQPTAFCTRCLLAGPLVAALQPHTRPGTLPVTRPGLPTQGLWRAEIMGPTQNWPLLILFHEVLECPS